MAQMALNLSNMVQGCQINTLMSLWHPLEQFKRYSLHQQYIYTIFHAKGTSSSNLLLVPANSRPSNKNVSSKDQNTKDMVLGSLRMTPTSLWQPWQQLRSQVPKGYIWAMSDIKVIHCHRWIKTQKIWSRVAGEWLWLASGNLWEFDRL